MVSEYQVQGENQIFKVVVNHETEKVEIIDSQPVSPRPVFVAPQPSITATKVNPVTGVKEIRTTEIKTIETHEYTKAIKQKMPEYQTVPVLETVVKDYGE